MLAQAVGGLRQLVHLALDDCPFNDADVHVIMSRRRECLRILSLAGTFSVDRPGSYLTDTSLYRIAKSCPNLQFIDLSYQRLLAIDRIADFMQASPHEREARFAGIDFPANNLEQMLTRRSASKLYLFAFGTTDESQIDLMRYA